MKHVKTRATIAAPLAIIALAALISAWVLIFQPGIVRSDGPGQPTGLTAQSSWFPRGSGDGIQLSWTAPTGPVIGYQILRQRSACDTGQTVFVENTNSTSASYLDTDVVDGITYTYNVKAINSDDTGPQSDSAEFTYVENPRSKQGFHGHPDKPTEFQTWNTDIGIQLDWEAPDDRVAGYQILRRRSDQCQTFQIRLADTGNITTHWTDEDVEIGATYEYRIAGIAGNDNPYTGHYSEDSEVLRSSAPQLLYVVSDTYNFPNRSIQITIAVNGLAIDDDADTVDYTLRGDVTFSPDGSDADECEKAGLGEVRQIKEVDHRNEQFEATFGGAGCGLGNYRLTHVVHDGNSREIASSTIGFGIVGPIVTGTPQVGQTLTADASSIRKRDGYSNATFRYQWMAKDGSTYQSVHGATSSNYTVAPTDTGKTIEVIVWATDDLGQRDVVISPPTTVVKPFNNAPTGTPTISGTPRVGETLTATTSGVADADGMTDAVFSYRWVLRDLTTNTDTDIEDGTSSTYVLADTAEGKAVKVRVTFTDDAGNVETLTSAATEAVSPRPNRDATGAPAISGTARVGETLTATTSGIADADGLTNAVFAYQWLRHDLTDETDTNIDNPNSATYTVTADDQGKALKVRVTFADDAGHDETLTSAATATVPRPPLTAITHDVPASHDEQSFVFELRFSETPEEGFSYETVRNHAFTVTGGSVTYVRRLEAGKNIEWEITVTPSGDGDVVLSAPATTDCDADGAICTDNDDKFSGLPEFTVSGPASQPAANHEPTGGPVISGTPTVGETLTATTSGIADADGMTNAVFAYRWILRDLTTNTDTDIDIEDGTGSTYVLADADEGKAVKVRVTFTDDAGHEHSLTSAATEAVSPRPNRDATGAPTISGTPRVGETLTATTSGVADADGLTNAAFSYRWVSHDLTTNTDTDIEDGTSSTYPVTEDDQGKAFKVRVTFTDDAGHEETLTSAATAAVPLPPLTAAIHDKPAAPHDGENAFTFELRFSETPVKGFSYKTLKEDAFTVTGGAVLNARRLEKPHNVRWEITVRPDGDGDVVITLPATTNCNDDGAICTDDGRMLSSAVDLTVKGPSG